MYPAYCRNIFVRNGWDVEWLGGFAKSEEGYKLRAGSLAVSREILQTVRQKTGIRETVLNYGEDMEYLRAA